MNRELQELDEWHKRYNRGNCKHGNLCVHCCPVCCTITDDIKDEEGMLVGVSFKGIRFEPKDMKNKGGKEGYEK